MTLAVCATPNCDKPVKAPLTGICGDECICVKLGLCAESSACASEEVCGKKTGCAAVGICGGCFQRRRKTGSVLKPAKPVRNTVCIYPDCGGTIKHPLAGICVTKCHCVQLNICTPDSSCGPDSIEPACGTIDICAAVGLCGACYQRQYKSGSILVVEKPEKVILSCSVDGCEKEAGTMEYCNAHYLRSRRHGDPEAGAPKRRVYAEDTVCKVEGCTEKPTGQEFCRKHWAAFYAHGDPTVVKRLGWEEPRNCIDCQKEMCLQKSEKDGRVRYGGEGRCTICRRRYRKTAEELRMSNKRAEILAKDPLWMQECQHCKRTLLHSEYGPATGSRTGFNLICIVCNLLAPTGMKRDQYEALHAKQGGRCAICKTSVTIRTSGAKTTRVTGHLDHDHSKVPEGHKARHPNEANRGILCEPCNWGLGLFKDSTEVLQKAVEYLEYYNAQITPTPPVTTVTKRQYRQLVEFDDKGQICTKCKRYLTYDNFASNSRYRSGYSSNCSTCVRLANYGMTYATYKKALEDQENSCPLCKTLFSNDRKATAPNVDHDHRCCDDNIRPRHDNCTRSILCGFCNWGLGQFRDNITSLTEAINYLEGHAT